MLSPAHHAVLGGIDDRAAVFLSDPGLTELSLDPLMHKHRLEVNGSQGFEFENDFFSGRVLVLHRPPDDYKGHTRYKQFFSTKKRRWELRWQGQFKKPLSSPVVFGAEILASKSPKHNFASRAFMSLLFKFSASLARNRGAALYTNMVGDQGPTSPIKYFHFPIHTSDLILCTSPGETLPDIASPFALAADATHTDCRAQFKNFSEVDTSKTYTFVFYSMYADFVSWDVCNVPIGLNGMSLNRLVGNQPISVVMRSKLGIETDEEYFRLILANRCTSPDWSSFLTIGERFNTERMSEFFSVVSGTSFDEYRHVTRRRERKRSKFFGGVKRVLAQCFRAPVAFVMSRDPTPKSNSRRKATNPPVPDSRHVEFVTPISEESEKPNI
jgi:hypothetical protein